MIRQAIKLKGYTQPDVASKLGITRQALIYKLNNPIKFTRKERRKLCRMLTIPFAELERYIEEVSL